MSALGALAIWLLLLALLAVEFVLATVPGMRAAPPIVGLAMALLVATSFMRLVHMRGAAAIFALAGTFWMCILLGLGSLEPATRHDIAVPQHTRP